MYCACLNNQKITKPVYDVSETTIFAPVFKLLVFHQVRSWCRPYLVVSGVFVYYPYLGGEA